MAISPLGGTIYANQNTHVASQANQLEQGKLLLQNYMASEIAKDKNKIVEETRPAEEIEKIKPDKEHEKNKKDQEEKNDDDMHEELKKREGPKRIQTTARGSSFLDIKV